MSLGSTSTSRRQRRSATARTRRTSCATRWGVATFSRSARISERRDRTSSRSRPFTRSCCSTARSRRRWRGGGWGSRRWSRSINHYWRTHMWRRGLAAVIAAVAVIACNGEKKAPAADTASAAPATVAQTDFTKDGPYIFVSNEDGNDVTVISAKTDSVVATIDPGQRPRGVRVSPDGKYLIVAVSGSPKAGPGVDEKTLPPADRSKDGIALIDLSTGKKIANL